MSLVFSRSLRLALSLLILLIASGCGQVQMDAKPSEVSSTTSSVPVVTNPAADPTIVGSIQAFRGPLLGSKDTDVWLVTHTQRITDDDRPSIRGILTERGTARRGNLVSQTILPNGFTFTLNWGPQEQDQGYGTSTKVLVGGEEAWQGSLQTGSSTQAFTLRPVSNLPSFELHRIEASSSDQGKGSCHFAVEYPAIGKTSAISEVATQSINTKIVQSLQSGTTTIPMLAQQFLQDCKNDQQEQLKDAASNDLPPTALMYDQTVEPDISFANDQVMSVVSLGYSYTGGAHGNYGYDAHTYNLKTGAEISLADLVQPNQLQAFYKRVSTKLLAQNRDLLFPETATDIERFVKGPKATSTESQISQFGHITNWYLTNEGIVFFYNPYEIAPYAAGVQEVTLPFSEWRDLAQAETSAFVRLP